MDNTEKYSIKTDYSQTIIEMIAAAKLGNACEDVVSEKTFPIPEEKKGITESVCARILSVKDLGLDDIDHVNFDNIIKVENRVREWNCHLANAFELISFYKDHQQKLPSQFLLAALGSCYCSSADKFNYVLAVDIFDGEHDIVIYNIYAESFKDILVICNE